MKRKLKQSLVVSLSIATTIACAQFVSADKSSAEVIPSWASSEISTWKTLGLIKGNDDGTISPNRAVTKSEFVTMLNRVFNLSKESNRTFSDVPASAWYASEIAKAHAAGIITGDTSGKMAPLENLSREKAALILSRLFEVSTTSGASGFKDDNQVSQWAKDAVHAMKAAGYIAGTPEGLFQPGKELTRAEAIKMINNIMGTLVADADKHSNITGKNLVVNMAGGTLSGVTLSGNLYITPGVGEGNLTIENSKIAGTIYVLGGGVHSVELNDTQTGSIVINKEDTAVRVVLNGTSSTDGISVLSDARLENTTGTAPNVTVAAGSDNNVALAGKFGDVTVISDTNVGMESGSVTKLSIANTAAGSTVTLGAGTSVGKLNVDGAAEVKGTGKIAEATINVNGVKLETAPDKVTVKADSATIGGKEVKGGTGSVEGGSGGGIIGGGGSGDADMKQFTYNYVTTNFADNGPRGYVKLYLQLMQDPTYDKTANPAANALPDLVNAGNYVNADLDIKPSIFAALRGVNTSVLKEARDYLWIGTDSGVTRVDLATNDMVSYTKESGDLADNKVLLLVDDGNSGVYAVTVDGVSHIME
ncbi:S-layer homology domain-containing protein [Paenibacillus sp. BC26]|uniref:S-layer homology domain-containing protein n=1 Tax=Paenibacillus sp. BC26 TaxID=1881032 RepID=UPI0008E2928D|nr:S-layer homology domain-containing protein [Paenibacillus sp. BC26]SFT20667.1 S-layer homology domain-containing protein [Paenibacillus sp. BC26]